MVAVTRSTVIDAPISAVWEVLRDFNGHDRWHPAVAHSDLEGGLRTDQIGAVRSFTLASGERLREQLLSMSDRHHHFRYAIVESEVPLYDYVAEVQLKPVTDGARTFWSWSSRFRTPPGRDRELAELVAEGVYEAGFEAVRARVEQGHPRRETRPAARPAPAHTSLRSASTQEALDGQAAVVERYGAAEELHPAPVAAPAPGPGEVRLRQTAIGVNFIDVYCRSGYFKLLQPPGALGMEAVGEVVDVGAGVRHLRPGMRAGYAGPPVGAYASVRTLDAALVVPLPDFLDDETAAAVLLKGMTAEFLLHRVHPVARGEIVLVYAPAGGVGQLICQWANRLGATVIGATSTPEKARVARSCGCHHVILPGDESLEDQVRALTRGHGADAIYDAVGAESFEHSVAALATCGHLVSFGQASGDIGARDIGALAGVSATLSRPNFAHYTDTPEKVSAITGRLFAALRDGTLRVAPPQRFALSEAAAAHRALEAGETTGSLILVPDTD
jgi:NADPH:quinone reductase-like Zn-dependent oxidoreductase